MVALCDCDCATKCPLGRGGSENRCAVADLRAELFRLQHSKSEDAFTPTFDEREFGIKPPTSSRQLFCQSEDSLWP